MKLKTGDTVMVIAGKDIGTQAKIAKVFPSENRIIVEGVATAKRHQREFARIEAAGDRVRANGKRHIGIDDFDNAKGRLLDAHAEGLGDYFFDCFVG